MKTELEVQPVRYFLIRGYDECHDGDEWIGIYDSLPRLKQAYEEAAQKLENEHRELDDNHSWMLKIHRPVDEVISVKFNVKHTYEIFEEMGVWWGGWNDCPDWRTMRNKAQEWHVKYGAELKEISHDTLMFVCRKLSEEEVDALWDNICRFAPNSRDIADEDVIKKRLRLNNEFTLWWD